MEFSFDITGLSQEKINYIPAALIQILFERGITYSRIACVGGVCTFTDPSEEFSVSLEEVLAMQEQQAAYNAAHDDGS